MARFHQSDIGEFIHPWVNKADTKFNADGLFHTDLKSSGPITENIAKIIEAAAKEALALHVQDMKPGEAKKWNLYVPFERVEDDETGEPTGEIIFTFKQNARIPSKKDPKGYREVQIEIRDSQNNVIDVPVWSGTEGRVLFSMRPIVMSSAKQVGVRLDFAKVQVTKLKEGSGSGGGGFDSVDGGFVADAAEAGFTRSNDNTDVDSGGDY